MPAIAVVTGDMFELFEEGHFDAIGHGCNCQNLMGAGIAPIFKKKYPQIGEADANVYRYYTEFAASHKEMLGTIATTGSEHGLLFNMYTQFNPGKNGDYAAIASAFSKADKYLSHYSGYKGATLGLPFIGCGIAGLDINAVITIANLTFKSTDVYFIQHPSDKIKRPKAVSKDMVFYEPKVETTLSLE